MAGTAIVCLEGVLTKGTPPNGVPIYTGIQMYHALATQFRLVVDSNHDDITEVEHWLSVNGLKRHVLALHRAPEEEALTEVALRLAHLDEWRAQGYEVAVYLTGAPDVAARLMSQGVTAILLAHPTYTRPEYRPDYEGTTIKPWDQIEEEITTQALLRDRMSVIDAEMDYSE